LGRGGGREREGEGGRGRKGREGGGGGGARVEGRTCVRVCGRASARACTVRVRVHAPFDLPLVPNVNLMGQARFYVINRIWMGVFLHGVAELALWSKEQGARAKGLTVCPLEWRVEWWPSWPVVVVGGGGRSDRPVAALGCGCGYIWQPRVTSNCTNTQLYQCIVY
jgi:hypothetical protein